jgi:uncharacterized protein (DUF1501 family)
VLLRTPEIQAPPANGAAYPAGSMGSSMRQAAQVIKAGLQTRCIFVNVPGAFDTHANQLPANDLEFGRIAQSLAAFHTDLGARMDDVVVMVTTEFGRAAYVNGSAGTDHGSGGRVAGRWPGLSRSQLYQERDLAVTTDYRDAFAEVARAALAVDTSRLFPGYMPGAGPGVVA